jgi:tellurite resistance protein TerC
VPREYQHRVLVWGIVGVIVLRGLMIAAGAALVAEFSWVLHVFAAFLIFTGVKMLFITSHDPDIANNPLLRFLRRRLRVTGDVRGHHFFVHEEGADGRRRWWVTPLFIALVMVETADLVFAVDSVPAIFAITTDPYIIYTSNIFAILGLRALYFALAAIIHRFHHLQTAMALVLVFIGGKVFAADLLGIDKVPAAVSLGVTVALLAGGVVASLLLPQRAAPPKSSARDRQTFGYRGNAFFGAGNCGVTTVAVSPRKRASAPASSSCP